MNRASTVITAAALCGSLLCFACSKAAQDAPGERAEDQASLAVAAADVSASPAAGAPPAGEPLATGGAGTPAASADATDAIVECESDGVGVPPSAKGSPWKIAWDHEIWCLRAAPRGRFQAVVRVENRSDAPGPIELTGLGLEKITPRPLETTWRQALGDPEGSFRVDAPFPIALAPGDKTSITVVSDYVLDTSEADAESLRANLHVELFGRAPGEEVAHAVGHLTLHLLTAGERESGGGPPAWRGQGGEGPDGERGGRGRGGR